MTQFRQQGIALLRGFPVFGDYDTRLNLSFFAPVILKSFVGNDFISNSTVHAVHGGYIMHTAAVAADTGLCEQPIRLQPWQQRVIETRTCGLQESTGEGDGSVEDDRYEQEGSRWCCLTGVCSAVCDSRGIKDREELKKKKKKKWQQRVNTEMWSVALTTDWPVTDHTVCWTLSRANSLTASSSIHHPHYRSGASISSSSSGDRGQLLIRLRCVRQSCTEHIGLSTDQLQEYLYVLAISLHHTHFGSQSILIQARGTNRSGWGKSSSILPSSLPSLPFHSSSVLFPLDHHTRLSFQASPVLSQLLSFFPVLDPGS